MAAKKHRKARALETCDNACNSTPPLNDLTPGLDWVAAAIYGVFFFLLFLVCSPALDSKFSLPKLIVFYAGVLVLCMFLIARIRRGKFFAPPRPVLLLTLALGGWWIISTPFALHVPTALNGEYDYYNGIWTHLCWLALFVASIAVPAGMSAVRKIAAVLAAAVVPVAAINILETTGMTTMGLSEVSTIGDRVAAGALMNFAIPFSAIALVRARRWEVKAALGSMLALFLVSEFLSQSRGAWVGLGVAAVVLAVGMARTGARWKMLAVMLVGVIAFAGLAARLNPAVGERFATLTDIAQDESVNQRFMYYRAALRAIGDHPVTGIGFENFRNSYPSYRGAEDTYFFSNIIPTMVHNGYLERALNNGIPALLLFLALVGTVLSRLVKELAREENRDRRDLLLGLLAALSAYLLHDMTGWLDLPLTSTFWILLGLAVNQAWGVAHRASFSLARPLTVAFSGLMIALSLYLLNSGYARLIADARLFEAQSLDVRSEWRKTESLVEQALLILPEDGRTEMVAGQIYINRFVASHDPGAYARGHELLEASYRRNRFDRMRLINIVALERAALELGQISSSSEFAQDALTVLTETDRDNPAFHDFKAKFFAAQGRFGEALEAIHAARRLAPQEESYLNIEAEYQKRTSAR